MTHDEPGAGPLCPICEQPLANADLYEAGGEHYHLDCWLAYGSKPEMAEDIIGSGDDDQDERFVGELDFMDLPDEEPL